MGRRDEAGNFRRKVAWKKALRDPLVICAGIGALLFAAYAGVEAWRHPPIAYTPAMAASDAAEFEAATGRRPNPGEAAKMKSDWIADELLFREALARHVELTDPEIRKRMIDKQRYAIAGAPNDPGEEDLVDFYATHQDRYRAEPRISMAQVYFAAAPRDGADILARLNRGEAVKGDDFWMGSRLPDYGFSMLRGLFGQSVLNALQSAPTGRWIGPLAGPRGYHFVLKQGQSPARRLSFGEVRAQVAQDWAMDQTARAVNAHIAQLQEKYDVADR